MRAKGAIYESKLEVVSPILLVYKLGRDIRVYIDYRAINTIIVKNRYPLLYIRETLLYISKAKVFIVLDIIATFN